MKNTMFIAVIVGIIVLAGAVLFLNSGEGVINGNVVTTGNAGDAQQVTLGMKNGNYFPNTIAVKANQPVEVTLDSSVVGCFRSFTIRDLGVADLSNNPSDTITFTPTKAGSFRFACSMGMGFGTIVVE
ncbi:MAG: cupredoxin domain-containing protein [Nanoarchaeota archaeon]